MKKQKRAGYFLFFIKLPMNYQRSTKPACVQLMYLLQFAIKDDGLEAQLREAMDLLMNGYIPERVKQDEKVKQMLNNIKYENTTINS